jgi:ribosomal protein S18 acetylase RimI-like enzyme
MVTSIRGANLTDAEAVAKVHVASWRESYEGIVPKAVLDTLSVAERTERWRGILAKAGHQSLYVAEQEGTLVGFAQGGGNLSDELGQERELYAIYLLSRVKWQGIGRRLLRTLVDDFIRQGANSASLWVFKENHSARRFYERLGARLVVEKVNNRWDCELIDCGYIWTDLKRASSSWETSPD